ncbi:UNVERIFIED_CONTAM: hypothetical protein RMT77_013375 [Armadillidium vulgare]
MMNINDQSIIINDLLSFISCKIKSTSKEKLIKTLRRYYSEKDISEARTALLTSLTSNPVSDEWVSGDDPLVEIYNYFQSMPQNELPIFVCKDLNNVPDLDCVKRERHPEINIDLINDVDFESENFTAVEKTLREEQQTMKSQLADIVCIVKQLKDQLASISKQNHSSNSKIKVKRKEEQLQFRANKILKSNYVKKNNNSDFKRKDLKLFKNLFDEEEEKTVKEESEKENESDMQDTINFLGLDYNEFESTSESKEDISCEVVKEEPEDFDFCFQVENDRENDNNIYLVSPSKSDTLGKYLCLDGSPSKTVSQKVIYIKNNEEQNGMEEEENTIEITSSADFLGNLEDPLNTVSPLDSIITIPKNTPSESIIIEKMEAQNGEGYYYKCQRCEFLCNEEKMILKHECNAVTVDINNRKPRRKNKFVPSNVFICTICDAYVLDVVDFNEHMLDHYKIVHGESDFECILCTMKTTDHDEYKMHLFEHSWTVPYSCDLCDYRSTKELRMRNHAVKHMECKGPNHFECLICGKICGTRNALEKHKQRHKRNYDFKCEICSLTFRHRSALSQHTANHTKERIFMCQICNYRYDSQHSLNVHFRVHFRDELFECHICKEKFKSKNSYRNHVLSMHEGIKPFKCDYCEEAFIFKHTMLIHRKTHGSQIYVCGYCNKKFKSQHYLKIHCAIHEGKNPFKCPSCEFSSTSKTTLKKHMHTHVDTLNLNLLSCGACNYVTVYPSEMDKHTRFHHSTEFDQSKMLFFVGPTTQ